MEEGNRIIVIGASAGGLDPLTAIISQLPEDFSTPVFIVKHVSQEAPEDILVQCLKRVSRLPVEVATHDRPIKGGRIYVAPPGRHLIISGENLAVTSGARENGMRPSVDALFRSAAAYYGSAVIGVILSGMLYDGCSGLDAIHRCKGICIVQKPEEASYPDMPRNAMEAVPADYCLPAAEIGEKLVALSGQPPKKDVEIPRDIIIEARIAERVLASIDAANEIGERSPFTCPDCGGGLWEIKNGSLLRFRCQTGHSFTSGTLLLEQSDAIEEVLWIALRMFEERRGMYERLMEDASRHKGLQLQNTAWTEKIEEAKHNIERIRQILITTDDIGKDRMAGSI